MQEEPLSVQKEGDGQEEEETNNETENQETIEQ